MKYDCVTLFWSVNKGTWIAKSVKTIKITPKITQNNNKNKTKDWWCWYYNNLEDNQHRPPTPSLFGTLEWTKSRDRLIHRRSPETMSSAAHSARAVAAITSPSTLQVVFSNAPQQPPSPWAAEVTGHKSPQTRDGKVGVHRVGAVVVVVEGLARQDATQTWRRFLLMHRKLFPPRRQCLPGVRRC